MCLAYLDTMVKASLSMLGAARSISTRKQVMATARAALKEARAARAALKEARAVRAVVKQARADLKAHRGKRELKIYRQALKDRRDKTVLQKWRCVHDGPP